MAELTISQGEVLIRLLVAVVLCGIIGFEREMRDHSAGFRTHMLLGLGAALFTLISAYGFAEFTAVAAQGPVGVRMDPGRIAAQIVTGIGFLGAGAIIRQGMDIRGLTTAASLWATAAIGMAAGAGYMFGAVATTAIVLLTLYLLRKVRSRIVPRLRTDFGVLTVGFGDSGGEMPEVMRILDQRGLAVRSLDAEIEEGRAQYSIQLRVPPSHNIQETLGEITALPSVRRVGISGLHQLDPDDGS
jgi:putative Mg2+ transporter-C (MgtC) family protein